MPGSGAILASLVVGLVVTLALRALPFLVIGPLRDSTFVRFLGHHMPVGVMVILTAYTLRTVPVAPWPHALPEVIGLAVTVGLHLWRRNATLSIVAGTLAYVASTSWVFT